MWNKHIRTFYNIIFNICDNDNQKSDVIKANNSLKPFISDLRQAMSNSKIALSIIFLYAFGIIIAYSCLTQMVAPVGGKPITEKVVRVNAGMSVMAIGKLLESNGLVRSSLIFELASMFSGSSHALKAGHYAINTGMSIPEIIKKIASGETLVYKFTIPEGLTIAEIAKIWEVEGFGTSAKFMEALNDPALYAKYGIKTNSLEGYLFPETYIFPYGISEKDAIEKMLSLFNEKVSEAFAKAPSINNLSLPEIVTLASIIEKEARVADERAIISAVFRNRLKLGMKLESCPTVLYELGYPNRELTYDDLRNGSLLHNTYVYQGLPPGPICNPGISSIIAAINPSNDKYLYFVSKNDGTHHFAENYNDFLNAKNKYQGARHS